MVIYLLTSKNESFQMYARDPKHIIELVEHYHEQAKNDGNLDNPKVSNWVRKIPTLEDITQIEKGRINFHVGMVNLNRDENDMDKDLFSEYMQVTKDFLVAVSPEAVLYFEMYKQQLEQNLGKLKRGELYKVQIPGGVFASLNFIPEDVMQAILKYDLKPHLEKGIQARENIEQKINHPNIQVAPLAAKKRLEKRSEN